MRALLLALLLAGCEEPAPAEEITACDTGPTVTWSNWGDGFFASYCRSCHSATAQDRHGAPVGVDFDTEAQVVDQEARIRQRVLVDETMPLGGGVYEEDLLLLEFLLDCGI